MNDPGKHETVTVTKRVKMSELPTRAQIVMNRDGARPLSDLGKHASCPIPAGVRKREPPARPTPTTSLA
jgi:hypothetical protein